MCFLLAFNSWLSIPPVGGQEGNRARAGPRETEPIRRRFRWESGGLQRSEEMPRHVKSAPSLQGCGEVPAPGLLHSQKKERGRLHVRIARLRRRGSVELLADQTLHGMEMAIREIFVTLFAGRYRFLRGPEALNAL